MVQPAYTPPPSGVEAPSGLVAEVTSFFGTFGRHVQSLLSLASLESKEAAGLYLRVVIAVVAGLVALLFGYLLALIFLAFLIATIFHWDWIWILLGFTVLHFGAVAFCAFYVRQRIRQPVFTETAAEFRKDFDAMANSRKSQP